MARQLNAVPNIDPANSDYPAGKIRDENLPTEGTPVTETLYGDLVQFFHKLMRIAGIAYNNLPENESSGFQFLNALAYYIRNLSASTTEKGVVELATIEETNAGLDSLRAVTPASLKPKIDTLVPNNDARLTNSRQCNNNFDNAATARYNLGIDQIALEVNVAEAFDVADYGGNYDVSGSKSHPIITAVGSGGGTINYHIQQPCNLVYWEVFGNNNNGTTFKLYYDSIGSILIKQVNFGQGHGGKYLFIRVDFASWIQLQII